MKLSILFFIFIFSNSCYSQISLDSLQVIECFDSVGQTTASGFSHFQELQLKNCPVKTISSNELKSFKRFVDTAVSKKHKQTKIGGGNLYLLGFTNGKTRKIVVCGYKMILDYSTNTQYDISENDIESFSQLINSWVNKGNQ